MYTKRYQQVVSALCSQSAEGQALKLCFTTDGYVDALALAASAGLLEEIGYEQEADDPFADDSAFLVGARPGAERGEDD